MLLQHGHGGRDPSDKAGTGTDGLMSGCVYTGRGGGSGCRGGGGRRSGAGGCRRLSRRRQGGGASHGGGDDNAERAAELDGVVYRLGLVRIVASPFQAARDAGQEALVPADAGRVERRAAADIGPGGELDHAVFLFGEAAELAIVLQTRECLAHSNKQQDPEQVTRWRRNALGKNRSGVMEFPRHSARCCWAVLRRI